MALIVNNSQLQNNAIRPGCPQKAGVRSVRVKKGDTLSQIIQAHTGLNYGNPNDWAALDDYEALVCETNKIKDPNKIYVGQKITLPEIPTQEVDKEAKKAEWLAALNTGTLPEDDLWSPEQAWQISDSYDFQRPDLPTKIVVQANKPSQIKPPGSFARLGQTMDQTIANEKDIFMTKAVDILAPTPEEDEIEVYDDIVFQPNPDGITFGSEISKKVSPIRMEHLDTRAAEQIVADKPTQPATRLTHNPLGEALFANDTATRQTASVKKSWSTSRPIDTEAQIHGQKLQDRNNRTFITFEEYPGDGKQYRKYIETFIRPTENKVTLSNGTKLVRGPHNQITIFPRGENPGTEITVSDSGITTTFIPMDKPDLATSLEKVQSLKAERNKRNSPRIISDVDGNVVELSALEFPFELAPSGIFKVEYPPKGSYPDGEIKITDLAKENPRWIGTTGFAGIREKLPPGYYYVTDAVQNPQQAVQFLTNIINKEPVVADAKIY